MLSNSPHEVAGEADNVSDAANLTADLLPSVLLLEVRLGEEDGLTVLTELRKRSLSTPTLVYSSSDNPTHAARALALGAVGFVPKRSSAEELVACISTAAAGGCCWAKNTSRRLSGPLDTQPVIEEFQAPLTRREAEVLKQLSLGLTNRDIAAALGISYETAKEHVQKILRKLGANDRTQAAVWAVRRGLA